jgi:hypothetical protein
MIGYQLPQKQQTAPQVAGDLSMKPPSGQCRDLVIMLINGSPGTGPGVRTSASFLPRLLPLIPKMGRLPVEKKHDRSERDRSERCNNSDQHGARADVDTTDAGRMPLTRAEMPPEP